MKLKRFVTYIHQYDKGMRGKNIGFIKVDMRDSGCRMEIQVRGLAHHNRAKIYFIVPGEDPDAIPVGELSLRQGGGRVNLFFIRGQIGESSYTVNQIQAVVLCCTNGGLLISCWKENVPQKVLRGQLRISGEEHMQSAAAGGKTVQVPASSNNIEGTPADSLTCNIDEITQLIAPDDPADSLDRHLNSSDGTQYDSSDDLTASQNRHPNSSDGTQYDSSVSSDDQTPSLDRLSDSSDGTQNAASVSSDDPADSLDHHPNSSDGTQNNSSVSSDDPADSLNRLPNSSDGTQNDSLDDPADSLNRLPNSSDGTQNDSLDDPAPSQSKDTDGTDASSSAGSSNTSELLHAMHTDRQTDEIQISWTGTPNTDAITWPGMNETNTDTITRPGTDAASADVPQSSADINESPQEQMQTTLQKIEITDIRNLPKRNWHLCSNSFLIHGFFNYHYLVLKTVEKNGEKACFLGVPGIYEQPERMMALLFGFPEFEPAQTDNEKKQDSGVFGYWMCRLEL